MMSQQDTKGRALYSLTDAYYDEVNEMAVVNESTRSSSFRLINPSGASDSQMADESEIGSTIGSECFQVGDCDDEYSDNYNYNPGVVLVDTLREMDHAYDYETTLRAQVSDINKKQLYDRFDKRAQNGACLNQNRSTGDGLRTVGYNIWPNTLAEQPDEDTYYMIESNSIGENVTCPQTSQQTTTQNLPQTFSENISLFVSQISPLAKPPMPLDSPQTVHGKNEPQYEVYYVAANSDVNIYEIINRSQTKLSIENLLGAFGGLSDDDYNAPTEFGTNADSKGVNFYLREENIPAASKRYERRFVPDSSRMLSLPKQIGQDSALGNTEGSDLSD